MKYGLLIIASALLLLSSCSKQTYVWQSDYDVSVMSFNIRYDTEEDGDNQWTNRKEACIDMISEVKPSFFGIQEGLESQVLYLDENLPDYTYVGVGRDDGETMGEFSAVFYLRDKFELLESGTFWLSETPDEPTYGWDAACKRVVTWVYLRDLESDKELYVFNTHFDHEGEEAREESGKLIINKINEIANSDSPIFITGDFNALKGNSIFDSIKDAGFENSRKVADHTDRVKSFNFYGRWYLNSNIDYVFFKNSKILSFRTVNKDYGVPFISDHYPIIGHFDF